MYTTINRIRFIHIFQCFFQVLGAVVLVTWLNPWSLMPAAISAIALLCIRRQYAQCSRDLKRLEGVTRSPFYSYLTSTIYGLKSIRSYCAEKTCSAEFSSYLDNNTRTEYLFITTNRWAAVRFDWITLFFLCFVTVLAIFLRVLGRQFSPADIALTLSYSLYLIDLLQWTIRFVCNDIGYGMDAIYAYFRQSVEVETKMTSVERILEYCQVAQEPSIQSNIRNRPPLNWPSQGRIVYNNVSMSYFNDPQMPYALSQISLSIEPGEKIGIVGRTGAGKTSFIQALFRMGNLVHGRILIDNIDIATVDYGDVRRNISIIPQDPFLFTGTLRSNLDQFGYYSDAEIWNALEQV